MPKVLLETSNIKNVVQCVTGATGISCREELLLEGDNGEQVRIAFVVTAPSWDTFQGLVGWQLSNIEFTHELDHGKACEIVRASLPLVHEWSYKFLAKFLDMEEPDTDL